MMYPTTPRALTKLRKICMALPNASETVSHGAPTFWAGKRTFAVFADARGHHGCGRHATWVNAAPGRQERMIRTAPDRFFRPPYVGPSGWLGVYLDDVCDWDELADILAAGHALSLNKSKPGSSSRPR